VRRFPVIAGPTASGKSALALAVARAQQEATGRADAAAILSADAFQVYRGMDVGTAKPDAAERARCPHELLDVAAPDEPFSVDRWLRLAEEALARTQRGGALPIVVGGTHLYVKALLEGLFEGPGADVDFRAWAAAQPLEALRRRLEEQDPHAAQAIHPHDRRRTIRALEVLHAAGRPISQLQQQWDRRRWRDGALLVAIRWPVEQLNARINARVRRMVERGLVEEVRGLHEAGALGEQAGQAIGYRQLVEHFQGRCTLEEAIERIKIETRRLAKQQRSWVRRLLATAPEGAWLIVEADEAQPPEAQALRVLEALEQGAGREAS